MFYLSFSLSFYYYQPEAEENNEEINQVNNDEIKEELNIELQDYEKQLEDCIEKEDFEQADTLQTKIDTIKEKLLNL